MIRDWLLHRAILDGLFAEDRDFGTRPPLEFAIGDLYSNGREFRKVPKIGDLIRRKSRKAELFQSALCSR